MMNKKTDSKYGDYKEEFDINNNIVDNYRLNCT